MFKNYFKIAFRNLWKHKSFSMINILGLALGLCCFITIGIYVVDELSYDRYNEKADRLYRINSDILMGGTELSMAVTPDPMGEALKSDYPQVEQYTRIYGSAGSKLIKNGNKLIKENNVAHVDSTFFDVFTLPAILGDAKHGLDQPNTVVITKTTAERYFGDVHRAIDQMIETDDDTKTLYKVTAVIEDVPKNSHFNFDFFFSMDNVNYQYGNYLSNNFQTYVLLRPGTDPKIFDKYLEEIVRKYLIPQAKKYMNISSLEDFKQSGNNIVYSLMPVTDIHLKSNRAAEVGVNGNAQYVYIFTVAAIFILLIACVNFMNLSTARSSGRAKEVGIRKVMGTEKKSLIWQFLTESTIMAYLSLILALLLAWLFLPWFNEISGKSTSLKILLNPWYLSVLIILPIIVGSIAGIYPAFYLSSFKPISVLKGKLNAGYKRDTFRSSLVIFQFTSSIILIIGTIVVYRQLDFIQSADIGFKKDQVMVVDNSGLGNETRSSLKNEIENLSGVTSASFGGYLPVANSSRTDNTYFTETVMTESNSFNMQNWRVDYDYISTLGMEMKAGRDFSKEFGADSTSIILNERAVELSGFDNPIGKKIYAFDRSGEPVGYTIIGVVKNFNFASLRENVSALCLRLGNNSWMAAYKLSGDNIATTISSIQDKYSTMAPNLTFSYEFLDDSFNQMYKQEEKVGQVSLTFAILAVIIACLGLFGLATYIAEQRRKEIGIRKVLGASIPNIVAMLSQDFVKLVLIAFLIAAPLAWWAMSSWLRDFAIKTDLSWWIFLSTGILALVIAITTLSFQAIKSAIANPVKSLRTE